MESTGKIRLVSGPYDGQLVEYDGSSEEIWVYTGLYGHTLAIRPEGFPRTPTMATYAVLPGGEEAAHRRT
jgi:hypothetical protein